VVRFDSKHAVITFERLGEMAEAPVNEPKVHEDREIAGTHFQGCFKARQRFDIVTSLTVQHAEQMQCIGASGLLGEDGPAKGFGVIEPALPMEMHNSLEVL